MVCLVLSVSNKSAHEKHAQARTMLQTNILICFIVSMIFPFIVMLQVDFQPHHESPAMSEVSAVDALEKDAAADGEFRVAAEILGEGEQVLRLSPDGQSLQPCP
jgi:hypothetical protein